MKPGETIRYTCDECLTVFGLSIAPVAEWAETMDDTTDADIYMEPTCMMCCPYCGASESNLRVTLKVAEAG